MKYRHITTIEGEQIIKSYTSGMGITKISQMLDKHRMVIRSFLKRNKVTFRRGKKYTQEKIEKLFQDVGYKLISKFITVAHKVKYACDNGHIHEMSVRSFLAGNRCGKCAKEHHKKHIKKHIRYHTRIAERNKYKNNIWRKKIFKRDKYTCQKCYKKGSYLNAHHLNGYHWDKLHRYDIDNGITLCYDCHTRFHNIYHNKNNTIIQYNQWNNKHKNKNKKLIKIAHRHLLIIN